MEHTYGLFLGGISEDDKLVRQGQVLYSENLDLTGSSNFITLAPKPASLMTTLDNIDTMYFLRRGVNTLISGTDNKEIYKGGVKVYDADHDVKTFWSNSVYLFWLDYAEDIFYIKLSDVYLNDWTGKVLTGASFTDGRGNTYVIEKESSSYITIGRFIYEIDNTNGQLLNTFDFCYETIVGLTIIAGQMKVFQSDGRVFLWDGIQTTPSQSFKLNTSILLVNQLSNQEYILGEGALYLLSGYTLSKVASSFNSDILEGNKISVRGLTANAVGILKQMIYITGGDTTNISDSLNKYNFGGTNKVLTFGAKKGGFPIALNNWVTGSSDGSELSTIYGLATSSYDQNTLNDRLYIAYRNQNGLYGIDYIYLSKQDYLTSGNPGLLVMPGFDGGNKAVKKRLTKLKIRADFDNGNGSFIFYKVIDGEMIPITGNESSSTLRKEGEDIFELMINDIFIDITLAIVFKPDSYYYRNSAIKLYSVTLDYEPIKQH